MEISKETLLSELQSSDCRTKLSLNQDWRFFRGDIENADKTNFDDSNWEVVCLPHTVRVETADCCGGRNYLGVAWYRKHFYIEKDWTSKKQFIEFQGAKHTADVWINGKHVLTHVGGYIPFTIDISEHATLEGDNIIVVKVDNSDMPEVLPGKPQGELDFCYFGGLYRNSWLHVTNKLHITDAIYANEKASGGVFFSFPEVSKEKATVEIKTHVKNEYEVKKNFTITNLIYDKNNNLVGETTTNELTMFSGESCAFKQAISLTNPTLWHPNCPYLYTAYTVVKEADTIVDIIKTRIGVRTIEFNSVNFKINGEPLKLSGANRHQEYVNIGDGVPDSLHIKDALKLREAGFNCIRTGHYPQSESFMDACDELGLLCIVPTPGWQWFKDTDLFKERSYQNIRELIRWHRNRPSIMIWEPILNETDYSSEFAEKAYATVHEEYPVNYCYAGCDSIAASNQIYDVIFSHNPVENKPTFTREYADHWLEQCGPTTTNYRCHRGIKGFYPGGEAGMLQSDLERTIDLDGKYQDNGISGACLWVGIDTNRGYVYNIAACGVFDLYRLPKFGYYLYKSQNNPDIRPDGIGTKPMIYIANFWTETSTTDVTIYSNVEKVSLYLNGELIGTQTPDGQYKNLPHPPFTFKNLSFIPGELTAKGFIGEEVVCTHTVSTPKEAKKLTLADDLCGIDFKADGSDVLMIYASITDENGTVVPTAYDKIHFSVDGPAEIVGDGDARVASNPINAEAGMIGVLIRSTKTAGKITVTAKCEGLLPATLEVNSVPTDMIFVSGKEQIAPKGEFVYKADEPELFSPPHSIGAKQNPNLAVSRLAVASSELEGYGAHMATNYNNCVRWSAATAETPQWWMVDLQLPCDLSSCKILFESDNTVYDYSLQVSKDKENWETVITNRATGQTVVPDEFTSFGVRYFKVIIHSVTKGLPSFYSCQVFGVKSKPEA